MQYTSIEGRIHFFDVFQERYFSANPEPAHADRQLGMILEVPVRQHISKMRFYRTLTLIRKFLERNCTRVIKIFLTVHGD